MLLAQSLRRLGRNDEARVARRDGIVRAERHLELEPDDTLSVGAAELVYEDPQRAVDWARRTVAVGPDDPAVWYNVACTYAGLGMKDEALSWLTRLFGTGGGHEWAANDPDFDLLRDDPRFQALLARTS